MGTATDDFNRADGALGNGWTVTTGTFTISSNMATPNGASEAQWDQGTSAGRQKATITCHNTSAGYSGLAVGVKIAVGSANGYWANSYNPGTGHEIYLWQGQPGFGTLHATYVVGGAVPDDYTIAIEYNAGNIEIWYNGSSVITHSDSTYAANERAGIHGLNTGTHIDAITVISGAPAALDISPSQIWAAWPSVTLLATLSNDVWPFPSDGTVSFSTNHGLITSWTFIDSTHAQLTFSPLLYAGSITITESKFGASDSFLSQPFNPNGDGGDYPIGENGAGIVNRTGDACPAGEILTTCHDLDGLTGVKILESLASLAYSLGGFSGQTEPTHLIHSDVAHIFNAVNANVDIGAGPFGSAYAEPLATTLKTLHQVWLDRGATGFYTAVLLIDEILDGIRGSGDSDLHNVRDDLGVWTQASYSSILDAIEQTRGDPFASVASVLAQLAIIRSAHSYTLEDIMDAIAAGGSTDLTPVLHKLDHIQPSESVSLTTLDTVADHINEVVDGIALSLSNMRTGDNHTLQDILDAIANLSTQVSAFENQSAPVWPGLAGATLGASVGLSNGLVVGGPLHGLLFQVTTQPAGAGRYTFGTVSSWTKVGACIFTSDRGDHERAQSFNLDAHLVCPKEMRVAASATIRLNNNWGGTVRPFTIN